MSPDPTTTRGTQRPGTGAARRAHAAAAAACRFPAPAKPAATSSSCSSWTSPAS